MKTKIQDLTFNYIDTDSITTSDKLKLNKTTKNNPLFNINQLYGKPKNYDKSSMYPQTNPSK